MTQDSLLGTFRLWELENMNEGELRTELEIIKELQRSALDNLEEGDDPQSSERYQYDLELEEKVILKLLDHIHPQQEE